jgi:hypothetical protein
MPLAASLPALHTPNVGSTYYVNATTGNDSTGTGASGAPWASLQKAYEYLRDTATWPTDQDILVEVAAGTYQRTNQQYTLDTWYNGTGRKPTATQWVIWNFAAGAVVKLPSGTSPSNNKGAMRLDTVSSGVSSYQMFIGMEIDGEQTRVNNTVDAIGVYLSGSTSNVQLVDCHIHGIYAMDTDDGSPTSKAQGVFISPAGVDNIITGCRIHDIGTATGTINIQEHCVYTSGDSTYIFGNVIYDAPNGYGVQCYDGGAAMSNVLIASNTIGGTIEKSCIVVPRNGTSITIKNNILYGATQYGVEFFPTTNAGSTNVLDYNVIDSCTLGDLSHATSTSWTITNTVTTDPLFTNYASRDFTLQSGSPAIGHADENYSTATDFAGVARDAAPDAGAYELAVVPVTGTAAATFTFASYSKLRDDELNQLEDAGGNPLLMPGVSGYVNLSDEVGGAASATWAFTAAAAGVPDTTGAAAATWALTGAASGAVTVSGAASGTYAFTGAALGYKGEAGTATATYSFAATAAGTRNTAGTATATYTFTGSAFVSGSSHQGTAAAAWTFDARHPLRDQNGVIVTSLVALVDDNSDALEDSDAGTLEAAMPVWVSGISGLVNEGAPQGTASATWLLTATVVGVRDTRGVAAASWQVAMAAVGAPDKAGTAVGTYELTATAAGVPSRAGAAAATWTLDAAASGHVTVTGQTAATYALTATAEGDVDVTGTATATWGFVATAVAEPVKAGALAATYTLTATASGEVTHTATAAATWRFTATASGGTEPRGTAAATWTLTATASGSNTRLGAATTTWTLGASVQGVRDTPGVAAATWTFTGRIDIDAPTGPQRERTRIRRHRPSTSARRPRHATTVRRLST